jgi:hypothetical protein
LPLFLFGEEEKAAEKEKPRNKKGSTAQAIFPK